MAKFLFRSNLWKYSFLYPYNPVLDSRCNIRGFPAGALNQDTTKVSYVKLLNQYQEQLKWFKGIPSLGVARHVNVTQKCKELQSLKFVGCHEQQAVEAENEKWMECYNAKVKAAKALNKARTTAPNWDSEDTANFILNLFNVNLIGFKDLDYYGDASPSPENDYDDGWDGYLCNAPVAYGILLKRNLPDRFLAALHQKCPNNPLFTDKSKLIDFIVDLWVSVGIYCRQFYEFDKKCTGSHNVFIFNKKTLSDDEFTVLIQMCEILNKEHFYSIKYIISHND